MPSDNLNIRELFKKYSESLRAQYEVMGLSTNHSLTKGERREDILRSFLSENLSEMMGVSDGQVFDKKGMVSRQCDIILYSKMDLSFRSKAIKLFPIGSVLGVCEVKSHLNKQELEDCIYKIQSVKRLERKNKPLKDKSPRRAFGWVYAFTSDSVETIKKNFIELSREVPNDEWIDLIYIHDEAIILWQPLRYPLRYIYDRDAEPPLCLIIESRDDSLLYLLFLLMSCIKGYSGLEIESDFIFLPEMDAISIPMPEEMAKKYWGSIDKTK